MKQAVDFKGMWLMFLLGNIYAVRGATAGAAAMTTCKTESVEEGDNGFMEFSFSDEINFTNASYLLYLKKNQKDADLLTCDCLDKCSPCKSNNPHFTTEGLIGHTLSVLIQNVTRELHGVYELRGFLNEKNYPATNCSLTVSEKSVAALTDNSPEVKTIVVPVVIVAVFVVIVAAILGFLFVRRRRRNREGPITSTTETEVMNPTYYSARSVEQNNTV